MLLYGSQQTFWEYHELSASEDGDAIRNNGDYLTRICRTANIPASVLDRSCSEQPEGSEDVNYLDWYTTVEDYTGRSITAASDRLPALIGLARVTAQLSKDQYLAGLWKSSLIEGLIWCGSQGAETLEYPGEYIAPSWSCASVAGSVRFPIYSWYDRVRWRRTFSDSEALASYISHSFQLRDLEPEGRLKAGWLQISAAILPIASIEPRQENPPRIIQYFGQDPGRSPFADKNVRLRIKTSSETTEIWVEGGIDKPPSSGSNGQRFVIFLTRLPFILKHGFLDHRFGLIVERVGDDEKYRRVGFVDGCVPHKVYSGVRRLAMKLVHNGRAEDY